MKNFKTTLLLFLLFIPLLTMAYNIVQEASELPTFGEVVWTIAKITLIQAVALAFTHIVAKTFVWQVWLKNNLAPAAIAFGIAVGLAAADLYLATSVDVIIELVIGETTSAYDIQGLTVIAFALVPVVQTFLFGNVTRTKAKAKARPEIETLISKNK